MRRDSNTEVIVEWLTGESTNVGRCHHIADVQLKVLNYLRASSGNNIGDLDEYTCADIVLLNVDSVVFSDPIARAPSTVKVVVKTGNEHTGAQSPRDDSYWIQALLAHVHSCNTVSGSKDWREALPEHCVRVATNMVATADDSVEVAGRVLLSYCANGGDNPMVIRMLCDDEFCDADEDAEEKEEERENVCLAAPLVGSTPIMYAAYHGHYAVVEALFEERADLNWEADDGEWTALDIAARRDHGEILLFLLHNGARVENGNGSALHVAAEYGSTKTLKMMLAKTPLGHPLVDIGMVDNKGETALHWAVESDQGSATLYLGRMKADLNKRNNHGETPLYRACYQGYHKCVECLLELKAQLNVATDRKHKLLSPLHISAEKGRADMVELLLEAGADPGLLDYDGKTPMQRALLFGGHVVADVFRQFGVEE